MNTRKPSGPLFWWLGSVLLTLLLFGFVGSRLGTQNGLLGLRFGPPNSFLGYQLGTPNLVPPGVGIMLHDPNIIEVVNFGPATMTGVRASISGAPPVYMGTIRPMKNGINLTDETVKTWFWMPHPWPAGSSGYMKVRLRYWADGYLQDRTYHIRSYPRLPFEHRTLFERF